MPNHMVDFLNDKMDRRLDDFSDYLVGKVSQELHFDKETRKYAGEQLTDFIIDYHKYTKSRNSMGQLSLDTNKKVELDIIAAWYVRQFENEYNPIHFHNGHVSGVGYLKLPENFGETVQSNKKSNLNGHLSLIHGNRMFNSSSMFNIKPEEGDFYFFPNYMMHTVFPFYGPGERRSISFNANIDQEIYNVYG